MTTWTISTLERELSDGGVVVAHWRATLVDGEHSASSSALVGLPPTLQTLHLLLTTA